MKSIFILFFLKKMQLLIVMCFLLIKSNTLAQTTATGKSENETAGSTAFYEGRPNIDFNDTFTPLNAPGFGYAGSEENWVLQEEVKGVKVYYQLSTCENNSVVYLRFDNTNNYPVRITWKEVFVTRQVPEERQGIIGEKQLTLAPGVTSQSDCTAIKVKECVTLSYLALPSYKADIVKFKLKDINVTDPS